MGSARSSRGLLEIIPKIVKKSPLIITLFIRGGSAGFQRGLLEVIPITTERGLLDKVGV